MPTYDLGLEHVSLAFATKNIFTDVTQGVFEGDRIGIVGKNGDGKSTLLHLFRGAQEPDSCIMIACITETYSGIPYWLAYFWMVAI